MIPILNSLKQFKKVKLWKSDVRNKIVDPKLHQKTGYISPERSLPPQEQEELEEYINATSSKDRILSSLIPPREVYNKLCAHVIGQHHVKKVLSVGVFNHYKRTNLLSFCERVDLKNDKKDHIEKEKEEKTPKGLHLNTPSNPINSSFSTSSERAVLQRKKPGLRSTNLQSALSSSRSSSSSGSNTLLRNRLSKKKNKFKSDLLVAPSLKLSCQTNKLIRLMMIG